MARCIGDNVRRLRLAQELQVRQLAKRSRYAESTLCDIESGRIKIPSGKGILRLANALRVSVAELYEGVR